MPEYDGKRRLVKGLDVVCQCAALLEQLKTHIKTPQLFCHPRAWLLARPENDKDVLKSIFPKKNDHTNLRSQCAPDTTGFLSDVYKRSARAQKTRALETACSEASKVVSSGRSMIEMLGVLAIIGVLSVGGIAGYSKAMEKIHVNKIIHMVSDISATIKTAYISQKKYDDFDGNFGHDYSLQTMGLLPPEYMFELEGEKRIGLSSPLTLINPVAWNYNSSNISVLSIGILVPQNLCVPLITYNWRNADIKGIVIYSETSDKNFFGEYSGFIYTAFIYGEANEINCNENLDDIYACIEIGKQRFKPVTPARAAIYCQSAATDAFGTGQMYVGFDLLADIKVPK